MREFTNSTHARDAYPDARTLGKAFGDPDGPDPFEREAFMFATMGETGIVSTADDSEYGVDDATLAIPTEVITPEEFLQTLLDLPEPALNAANALVAYADGVLFLVLNLRVLFLDEIFVDWDALLKNSELVGKEPWMVSHEKGKRSDEEGEKPEGASAATRQAVRSTFRIMAGVCIGFLLWFIVRKL